MNDPKHFLCLNHPWTDSFSQSAHKDEVVLTHLTEDKGEARRVNRMHMVAVTTPLEKILIPKDMRREN